VSTPKRKIFFAVPTGGENGVLAEIRAGHGLTLSAAAKLFPGVGKTGFVSLPTVLRWATKGCRTAQGEWVKLESVRIGRHWTSRPAVERFVAAVSSTPYSLSALRSSTRRRRDVAKADAKLAAAGC
jgi:hypothetical protein